MHAAVLTYYSLGGSSAVLTLIATVLNALCYASSKYTSLNSSSADLAFVSLSAVSCIGLIILTLLLRKDIRTGRRQWKTWKTGVYFLTTSYLLITIAFAAGVMAWSDSQLTKKSKIGDPLRTESLFIARSVIWATSVFVQGLFCGFLLLSLTKEEPEPRDSWARPASEMRSDSSRILSSSLPWLGQNPQRSSVATRPMTTMSGKLISFQSGASSVTSRTSNSYSGLTLLQQDASRSSPVLNAPGRRFSEPYPMRRAMSEDSEGMQKFRRSQSRINSSLDNLILQTLPETSAPVASPTEPDSSKPAPKQETSNEGDIHPLFRPNSPSPPPTPTAGTVLVASPAAGQTITTETLHRMRSSSLLRANGARSRSSTFDRAESPNGIDEQRQSSQQSNENSGSSVPRFILQANVRESRLRYEKKYNMSECSNGAE